tara:strand:- start:243371 stop:244252 length:882 start_codon:yes stop_codon:yes gene_type:complete
MAKSKERGIIPNRPAHFSTPVECVNLIKKSVYFIARGRALDPEKPSQLTWVSLGTGCVVSPHRMITAAHVINDPKASDEIRKHKEGDKYYLIRHDDEGNGHFRWFDLLIDKTLFIYPEVDLCVMYLDEEFYTFENKTHIQKDDFIRIDKNFRNIGTATGVLGYPLCKLEFNNGDVNSPMFGNILLRVDTGVVNCRYRDIQGHSLYEFTLVFNPGNSGGPIFDIRTGQLLSIVHGYYSQPIKRSEVTLTGDEKRLLDIKTYKADSYIDVVHATYSIGFATPSFIEIFDKHQISE